MFDIKPFAGVALASLFAASPAISLSIEAAEVNRHLSRPFPTPNCIISSVAGGIVVDDQAAGRCDIVYLQGAKSSKIGTGISIVFESEIDQTGGFDTEPDDFVTLAILSSLPCETFIRRHVVTCTLFAS